MTQILSLWWKNIENHKRKDMVLPSHIYEGCPMAVPETFSMHTPMIVGDIGTNAYKDYAKNHSAENNYVMLLKYGKV